LDGCEELDGENDVILNELNNEKESTGNTDKVSCMLYYTQDMLCLMIL